MLPFRLTIVLCALLVAACAPEPVEEDLPPSETVEPETPPELEECDAADYRPLIGTSIAAATLPVDERLRAYGDADIVTQEYIPQRTNIVYDADGLILRVFCG